MITLLETPVSIILFGIVAEVVLLVTLLLTGRGVVLVGMIGTVVLVAVGVGLEWLVVTQRERVEAAIYRTTAAFEANDLDTVLVRISHHGVPLLRQKQCFPRSFHGTASDEAVAHCFGTSRVGEKCVLDHCSPSAVHSRSEARRAFGLVQFTELKITELKIERIDRRTDPPTTKAHFVVLVSALDRNGSFGHVTRPIWFNLDFRLEGDRWMITGHELENAPYGF